MNGLFKNNIGFAVILTLGFLASAASAQSVSAPATQTRESAPAAQNTAPVAAAPQTFKTKYEGGIFGYNRGIEGTMSFDDANRRLVFRDKRNATLFVIPYDTVIATFGDTRKRTSTGGRVASSVPTPYGIGQLGRLFKSKIRYLTLQYTDPDTNVTGTASFKVGNQNLLTSVVSTLATKANLTRRGEIYVRPRKNESATTGVL